MERTWKFCILNSFHIKVLAIVLMVIDHVGAILLPQYRILRIIGRLSFPLFAFLLVVGFHYTRDVWRYFLRLLIFGLLSEVIYDLAFRGTWLEFSQQNIFFTLALGVLMLIVFEKSFGWLAMIMGAVICMLAADLICCDYRSGGLILILFIHLTFGQPAWSRALSVIAGNAVVAFPTFGIQVYGGLAAIPVALYNGKEGPKMKYFFYLFYPLHLLILYLIKRQI
ncbi:MAG: TraX family protein [Lachnospiraceae bacterium]